MGTNVSKQSTKLLLESITDASTEYLSSTLHSQQLNVNISGDQIISFTDTSINCDNIELTNVYDGTVNVYSTMSNSETIEFEKFLTNNMGSIIQNFTEQLNKDFNFLQTNVDIKNTDVTQRMIADLSTLISQKTQQVFNASVTQNVTQQIVLDNVTANCNDGNFTAKNVINIRTIVANTMKDSSITELVSKMANTMQAEVENVTIQINDGLNPMDFFLGPLLVLLGMIILTAIAGMFFPKIIKAIFSGGAKAVRGEKGTSSANNPQAKSKWFKRSKKGNKYKGSPIDNSSLALLPTADGGKQLVKYEPIN